VRCAQTKAFAYAVAALLERMWPDRVVSRMEKRLRTGRVFVDWSQNDVHKTTVNVYSLRAQPTPTVSAPLSWEELAGAARRGCAGGLVFTPAQVLERVAREKDLASPVLSVRQRPPAGLDSAPLCG